METTYPEFKDKSQLFNVLTELEEKAYNFRKLKARNQFWWYILEIFAIAVGLLTPIVVGLKDESETLKAIWKPWCIIMPPMGALALAIIQKFRLYENYISNKKKEFELKKVIAESRVKLSKSKGSDEADLLHQYLIERSYLIEVEA